MAKRGNHEGSLWQRKDGRWVGAGFVHGLRRSFYGTSREEANGKLIEALAANREGRLLPGERLRVGPFLDAWLESKRYTIRPSTFQSYTDLVTLHLKPELESVVLSRLSVERVQAMINKKHAAGLSPRRVEYIRNVLRNALNQALAEGKVSRNVAIHAHPPRKERHEMLTLDPKQAQNLVKVAQGDRLGPLYILALATGMRSGECLGLTWADIHLDKGALRVDKALQRIDKEYRRVEPKTDKSRRALPLSATAIAALKTQRAQQIQERLRVGTAWADTMNLVFTNELGGPLHATTITHQFRKFMERAGLPVIRFHDLRHTAASLMLAQGVDARVLMDVLGHSQYSLTMNHYAHIMPNKLEDAASKIDVALTGT